MRGQDTYFAPLPLAKCTAYHGEASAFNLIAQMPLSERSFHCFEAELCEVLCVGGAS